MVFIFCTHPVIPIGNPQSVFNQLFCSDTEESVVNQMLCAALEVACHINYVPGLATMAQHYGTSPRKGINTQVPTYMISP